MLINLQVGQFITPKRIINPQAVAHWKFCRQAPIFGGLMPGARLKIVEINKVPGAMWLKAELPGFSPPTTLTISGEEFAMNFIVIR